ncbi:MAG: hypothetical protein H0T73_05255 [Ardenticatenales bacterium]|nr:hypothetical protein [Ardenticatenales bacterium]
MDQNIQILLYFGALMLLATMATVSFLLFARREGANKDRHKRLRKRPDEEVASAPRSAQVQLVWAGEDMPLIWMVEGQTYAHPDSISSPEQRAIVEQFVKKLGESLPGLLVPRPIPASSARKREPTAPAKVVEPAVVPPTDEAEGHEQVDEVIEEAPPVEPDSDETDKPTIAEPSVAPPSARTVSPRPRTYEEMMELPFLERLKASFFGPREPTPVDKLNQAERQLLPTLPKVDDLNTILQSRLARLTDAPLASIRPTTQGLLEIIVDGKIYERIDDVPDEQVRATMREAVRIWEQGMQ